MRGPPPPRAVPDPTLRGLLCAALCAVLGSSCATGLPAGAVLGGRSLVQRPFSPPAAPRERPFAPERMPLPDSTATAVTLAVRDPAATRETLVATARKLLGSHRIEVDGKAFQSDCVGLVSAVYHPLGVDLLEEALAGDNGVTALHRYATRNGKLFDGGWPKPGDLVFFRETYDQNRDGRRNDGLTHVAVVEKVDSEGTIQLIHRVSSGVRRYRMNLRHPDRRRHPTTGAPINDYLRSAGPEGPAVLTGELFAGFATLIAPVP